jgi:dihydrofolate synthase / folylpolyglutamate synthase
MAFQNLQDAIAYIFETSRRLVGPRGLDEHTRDISPTRRLLLTTGLLKTRREYVVITGSKGKGSTAAITAKLLQSLGHRTGLVTGPHLVYWEERIRVDGQAIPTADFLRILSELKPFIDDEIAGLTGQQYLSPQGIFLLMALKWFDEQHVDVGVMEVGRGGRYDDMSLVPNHVALFTPIVMEHAQYLGNSLERIAWHKSGIIDQGGVAYSVPQAPEVMEVIQREAEVQNAEFTWIASLDCAQYVGDTPDGIRLRLGRYGEVDVPLMGRYQADNITLAVQAVGKIHARLPGIPHGSQEYVERIRTGLQNVRWYGRLQKLQENPPVYVEGAVNPKSVQAFITSMTTRAPKPWIIVTAVPRDRDVQGVYRLLAAEAQSLIITSTDIHPNIHFPKEAEALSIAKQFHTDVTYREHLPEALDVAFEKAGTDATILLAVAQPLVGECMLIWKIDPRNI